MSTEAAPADRSWDSVLEYLSTLITFKTRADGKGWRDAYENMPVYLKRLGMDKQLQELSIIHVAGTKGKGSTCAMVESMLRSCGYRTGLYTSPHLCDVRERVRINGQLVSKEVFAQHFWTCYDTLKAAADDTVGMPGYFRFITLLGLHIFLAQRVDVVVLEVGIGGRLDATNVVDRPVACGITSLGFDHQELLGDTIELIAAEKAGIMKPGAPVFSAPQPPGAMAVLLDKADKVGTSVSVPPALSCFRVAGASDDAPPQLGVPGEHQALNASLAVQLAAAWEAAGASGAPRLPGWKERVEQVAARKLPAAYAQGLAATSWPGRSQVVHDPEYATGPESSRLSFYLDGAHTPESMATCAAWFADAVGAPLPGHAAEAEAGAAMGTASGSVGSEVTGSHVAAPAGDSRTESQQGAGASGGGSQHDEELQRVLVFNCMRERNPSALLPELQASLAARGVRMQHALFVPPDSQYGFLATSSTTDLARQINADTSWQQQLRGVWDEYNASSLAAAGVQRQLPLPPLPAGAAAYDSARGAVMPGVQSTIDWLRSCVKARPRLKLQVLVTGSLYLVGDTLRTLGKAPQ